MSVPAFSIGLQAPTSTSKNLEVALRFAKTSGMVIQLHNARGYSKDEAFWDASWLSAFPEENERLFFGSIFRLQIETVMLVEDGKNYQQSIAAFYKLDAILSGDPKLNQLGLNAVDFKIIDGAIQAVLGDESAVAPALDEYIVDTLLAFTLQKTEIALHCLYIFRVRRQPVIGLLMNALYKGAAKRTENLFKPLLFSLFPNLTRLVVLSMGFIPNLTELLRLLDEKRPPPTFQALVIKGTWIHFLGADEIAELQKSYAAKGFKLTHGWDHNSMSQILVGPL